MQMGQSEDRKELFDRVTDAFIESTGELPYPADTAAINQAVDNWIASEEEEPGKK